MNWSILGKSKTVDEWRELIASEKTELDQYLSFLRDWWSEGANIHAHTSGSTGAPKLIQLPKSFMISSALATAAYFKLGCGSKVLQCLPSQFISGKMMMVRALVNQWNLTIVESTSIPNIPNDSFDFCSFTPMQLGNIIEAEADKLNRIKLILLGGAAVSETLLHKIQNQKSQIFLSYGMTETASHVAIRALNGNEATNIYSAIGDYFFGQDENSCLKIYHPPSGQEWISHDAVELINPRQFRFLGRVDNIINSGGLKIHPEQLENKLSNFLKLPFYFMGVPDELLGEKLVLFIESTSHQIDIRHELQEAFGELPSSYFPKEIRIVQNFERTASDKIIRKNYD